MTATDAVMLVAFGGPFQVDEVRPFLENVLRGKPVTPGRFEAVVGHYEVIGGRSPVSELTAGQACALETQLRRDGALLPVRVGMRFWAPYVQDVLAELAASGVKRVVAVPMAAYDGPASAGRYEEAVRAAAVALGDLAPEVLFARGIVERPGFVEANAGCLARALARIDTERRSAARVLFTGHSIPVRMAKGSAYVAQLEATAERVARAAGHDTWRLCWQSAASRPGYDWLTPDVSDVIREEAARGASDVVVAPIGFLCDHVEVIYDLDVEAAATAQALGVRFVRAGTVGDHPAFIGALAELVLNALA